MRSPQKEYLLSMPNLAQVIENVGHNSLGQSDVTAGAQHCGLVFQNQRHRQRNREPTRVDERQQFERRAAAGSNRRNEDIGV